MSEPQPLAGLDDLLGPGGRRVEKRLARAADGRDHAIAEVAEELLDELGGIDAGVQRGVEIGQRAGRVSLDQMPDQRRQPLLAGRAEHPVNVGHGDSARRKGQQLLQQRLAVAHRAGRTPGEHFQRLRLGLDPFGRHDLLRAAGGSSGSECPQNRTAGTARGS